MRELLKKKVFSDFFPTPEYLLLANSGLVITDASVKFVEFSRGMFKSALRLSHFERIPLPEGVVQSGFINDPDKLISILSGLSHRFDLRYVYATLPEERAYLFTTTIDKVPEEGLRDAVAFIIEENVPVQLANSVFDFDVIEDLSAKEGGSASPDSGNQLKVVVSVISRKVVDFYLQVFESAGITPVSFDIESQVIARAIVPKGDKRTQLIVNFTHKKTGFYIVEDGIVQFTTTLPYGTGSSNPSSRLNDLKTELRKIFAFWSARADPLRQSASEARKPGFSERKIERILLAGSGALNGSLVDGFKKESPVTCEVADAWINAPGTVSDLPGAFLKESLDYVSAIGLVLPDEKKSHV